MRSAAQALPPTPVRFLNRSFMALVMTPAFPMRDWFDALDRELARAPGFFESRPVVVDLSDVVAEAGPGAAAILLEGLDARRLRLVGVEGVEPAVLFGTPWARLAVGLAGRDIALEPPPAARADEPSLLVDRPVRSGQSIVFEAGDVTILGAVASGAEVLAGGSIHVYGALRGRAIAGLKAGPGCRIFCSRLEAELVGIDRLYRTAEHWGPGLHGRAAQVLCDRGALRLSPLT
ncbi:septum site-determining protein MinC [Phenylobacterium sp.]|uniref:septum site-determining protein MinC n=1 Tax=Phenylobacterium sp. TaxID=1871053 RepID=UPI0035B3F32F